MNEEGENQPISSSFGQQQGGSDKNLQEWRLGFTSEIRQLRLTITGLKEIEGRLVQQWPGLMCLNHFSEMLPMLHMANTKGWTLSKIYEEKAEVYVLGNVEVIHDWLLKNCYFCDKCGMYHDYSKLRIVIMTVESFFYGNYYRAVNGWEAENLRTMFNVVRQESYSDRQESGGFIKKIFGGGR